MYNEHIMSSKYTYDFSTFINSLLKAAIRSNSIHSSAMQTTDSCIVQLTVALWTDNGSGAKRTFNVGKLHLLHWRESVLRFEFTASIFDSISLQKSEKTVHWKEANLGKADNCFLSDEFQHNRSNGCASVVGNVQSWTQCELSAVERETCVEARD